MRYPLLLACARSLVEIDQTSFTLGIETDLEAAILAIFLALALAADLRVPHVLFMCLKGFPCSALPFYVSLKGGCGEIEV